MSSYKLLLLLLLSVVSGGETGNKTGNITLTQDDEQVDIDKQLAEGNIKLDGNNTQIKTKLTDLEIEVGDNQVYAGGKIEQNYDENLQNREDADNVIYESPDKEQKVKVHGTATDTDINIDIDREGKENVHIDFDVDKSGETYLIEVDDETQGDLERYREDKQYLDVYVEEQTGNYIAPDDDEVEIDIDVNIEGIDLDKQDIIRFEIDLFGDKESIKDTTNNSNIFIEAEYRNQAKQRHLEGQADPNPNDWKPESLVNLNCSEHKLEFDIPSYTVAERGAKFEQICTLARDSLIPEEIFSVRWVKIHPDRSETEVSDNGLLKLHYPTCGVDTAVYRCQMSYRCQGEERTETSNDMTLLVNNGIIVNSICQVFGDPHIITFDNTLYSFQGECTYLLAMDATYGRWIVYGRFTRCGEGTCLTSVMVYNQGFMIELQRGWMINLNGEKVTVKEGVPYSPDRSLNIYFDGYELSMELRRAQIQLLWDGLMNLKIEVTTDVRTIGLCGNNNGDEADDFMTYYGDVLNDVNEFGTRQAVDRYGTCTKPVSLVKGDTSEGEKYCREILLSDTFMFASEYIAQQSQGKVMVRSNRFMDSCVFDYMSKMKFGDLTPQCYAGYNYISILKRFGLCVPEGWQKGLGCITKEGIQDLIVTQGCPYGDSPFPFHRD